MVMQARKLPRLSDGYFDRNQTHSFENTNKFSKPNERTSDKVKGSPITSNSESSSRNDSLENKSSPRYHRPCSQRLKDKDHHDENSSKSPIVKNDAKSSTNKDFHKSRSSCEREGSSDHSDRYQSNHDRSGNEEAEKRLHVSDWSEHISSSGKKYYYNCKTEVSQWEKPKELIEYERQQNLARLNYDQNRAKEKGHERGIGTGGKNAHSHQDSTESLTENSESSHTESGSHIRTQTTTVTSTTASNTTTTSSGTTPSNAQVGAHLLSPSQVTLSNLPKLISQLAGTKGLPNLSELSPQEALRTIQQALQLTKQVANLTQTSTESHLQSKPSASPAQSQNQVNHQPNSIQTTSSVPLSNTYPVNSSGTTLFVDGKVEIDRDRNSPGSDSSTHSVRHDSPTSSVSSLHSLNATGTSTLATAALKPSTPSLTPSLANYYREDLISHVVGWQADHAERQANRYWEEAHNIGSLNCTQVSAELKMARALVRLAEIQATLQEQRILFLRMQTKELEDWRTVNSFMGDS